MKITMNNEELMEALGCGLQDVGVLPDFSQVENLEKVSEDKWEITIDKGDG